MPKKPAMPELVILVHFTPEQARLIAAAAHRARMSIEEWLRELGLAAAAL